MITGAHTVLYSRDPEADRAFLREVLGFRAVDAGGGYLVFALPPSEAAVHDAAEAGAPIGRHELYLMCDDVKAEAKRLGQKGIGCTPISDEGWGLLTTITLPGGGALGLYEPRHALAHAAA